MNPPHVAIAPQAVKRARNFDAWVFRDELDVREPAIASGDVVEVVDSHQRFVAWAFYSARSHIALRIVSLEHAQRVDRALLSRRLARAIATRTRITGTNAKRLVFSEADELPGLIVDQYAACLVVQFRSAGMDRLRAPVVELLREQLQPQGILERSDKEFREEEGLEPVTQVLAGVVPDRLLIEEDDLKFLVDPHRGLKTGFYLDQRATRRKLRQLVRAHARVLDAFSYTGSCAIAAARAGASVVCVEQDEALIELAKENAKLNGVSDRIEYVAGDAFYWLKAKAEQGAQFDRVMLDPPALVKAKAGLTKGRQALHHLVTHSLKLLAPSGGLVLHVCTYHLLGLVEEIVRIAASSERLRLRVGDQWLQAEDHPWVLQLPASRYLMSWHYARCCARDAQSAA